MSLELKAGAATEKLPTIALAGKPYYVARLPLKARIAIAVATPKVQAIMRKFPSKEEILAGASVNVTADDYLVMVDIICDALRALYPTVKREDLLEEEIELDELYSAYPVIIAQGTSRRPPAGEAPATSNSVSSSGEGSSPI